MTSDWGWVVTGYVLTGAVWAAYAWWAGRGLRERR